MGAWTGWRGLILTNEHDPHKGFWCPACKTLHLFDERWKFDNNWDSPTFTPSLSTKSGHYVQGYQPRPDGKCGWCESAKERGVRTICRICHLNITAGQIIFHADCTHEMAGKTVPLTRTPDRSIDEDFQQPLVAQRQSSPPTGGGQEQGSTPAEGSNSTNAKGKMMISPTPGRVVNLFGRPGSLDLSQPEAAIVTYVHSDRMINVTGFNADGHPVPLTSVPLRQPEDEAVDGFRAEWMPYQVGQAKKTEELQTQVEVLQGGAKQTESDVGGQSGTAGSGG